MKRMHLAMKSMFVSRSDVSMEKTINKGEQKHRATLHAAAEERIDDSLAFFGLELQTIYSREDSQAESQPM